MKTNKLFMSLFMGLAVVACTPKTAEPADAEGAEEGAVKEMTAKDYTPTKAEIDSVSYLVGVNFGSFIKGYNFGDLNYSEIVKGIKDFVKAKGNPQSEDFEKQFKIAPSKINDLFNGFLEKRRNLTMLQNKEKEDKYLAANAAKEGVTQTESGLQYKILEPGNDVKPGPKDTVWVKYKGTLIDGTVFDETPEDADPVRFPLSGVVAGWSEGLQLIGEGGHIELYVPADLAYGESGRPGIDPNSVLIFDVVLDKVGKFVPAPEEKK